MASEETPLLVSTGFESNNISNPNTTAREESSPDSSSPAAISQKWTRKQILTLVTISLMKCSLYISYSVIAPFYPKEAAKKGVTPFEVGLVFGVFQLIIFIMSPIYGSFVQRIGAKFMFLSGSFLLGGCGIAFGFLDRCPYGPVFVVMCFVSRSIEANGSAMLNTASFAILGATFPKNIGQAIGTVQIFSGIGMVIGPSVGGGLYAVGGYTLPFVIIGGVTWLNTVISYFVLPSIDDVPTMRRNIFSLFSKIPGCFVLYLVVIGNGMALSFLDPTFSPWMLKTFSSVTVPQVGLIFMTIPGLFAFCAPFAGYMCDKGYHGSLIVCGLCISCIAYLLLGPSPLLFSLIPQTIPLTIIALMIIGISLAGAMIPVFPLTVRLARHQGFEDNLQTYGLVSGYFQSGFSLGAFIGPTSAGYLADKFGFPWSTSIFGFINLGLVLIMLCYILLMKRFRVWPVPVPEETVKVSEETTTSDSTNA